MLTLHPDERDSELSSREHLKIVTSLLDRVGATGYDHQQRIGQRGITGFMKGTCCSTTSNQVIVFTVVPEERIEPILAGLGPVFTNIPGCDVCQRRLRDPPGSFRRSIESGLGLRLSTGSGLPGMTVHARARPGMRMATLMASSTATAQNLQTCHVEIAAAGVGVAQRCSTANASLDKFFRKFSICRLVERRLRRGGTGAYAAEAAVGRRHRVEQRDLGARKAWVSEKH